MYDRCHYSCADAFKAIRSQRCFDHHSNLEIRAAIRASKPYMRTHAVGKIEKHKHTLIGERTDCFRIHESWLKVKRMTETQFVEICLTLNARCPLCGSEHGMDNASAYYRIFWDDGRQVICSECSADKMAVVHARLRALSAVAAALIRGECSDEKYNRLTRDAYKRLERSSQRSDQPFGSESARLPSEADYRHLEGGAGGKFADRGLFHPGLTTTICAFRHRGRVILDRMEQAEKRTQQVRRLR
jgi:hypothetical protein